MSDPIASSEREAALVAAYREGSRTAAAVARDFGISKATLYRRLAKAKEPLRREADPEPEGPAAHPRSSGAARGKARRGEDPAGLERRLRRLLAEQVADLEREPERQEGRGGQALALAARTLATLRRTAPEEVDDAAADPAGEGRPARSLAELRDELLGHLERIRHEERTRRGLEPPRPE